MAKTLTLALVPSLSSKCSWCGVESGHSPRCYLYRVASSVAPAPQEHVPTSLELFNINGPLQFTNRESAT